ncbi:MAG TPA: DoxX family protein [Allosphingosinicella sp.]
MARTTAMLLARLIFAWAFLMAATFKFMGMAGTAQYIAAAGIPFPSFLAWVAAFFEIGLGLAFLTGAFFSEAAILAGIYVMFLAFTFHGPAHWKGNPMAFGAFFDHFIFLAGLLLCAIHGPGEKLVLGWHLPRRTSGTGPDGR